VSSFRVLPFLPFRAQWIALIIEFEWNHHFADVQKNGPFKISAIATNCLQKVRNGKTGTVVCDVIDYAVEFGLRGEFMQKFFIRNLLQPTFA
jgi:ligand-binding SRPBCC domain-containing protein